MTPVPLGSFWGGPPTGGDTPAVRPACPCDGDRPGGPGEGGIGSAWTGGPVTAWTGGALALIGLTLPWATIEPAGGTVRCLVRLTDLSPAAAPAAALLLVVVGAGAAVSFGPAGRAAPVRWITALLATIGAVAPLVLTVGLLPGTALADRNPLAYRPDVIRIGHASPWIGCVLHGLGLLLVAAGVGGSGRNRPGAAGDPTLRGEWRRSHASAGSRSAAFRRASPAYS